MAPTRQPGIEANIMTAEPSVRDRAAEVVREGLARGLYSEYLDELPYSAAARRIADALAAAGLLAGDGERVRIAAEIIDVRRSGGAIKGTAGSPKRLKVDRALQDAAVRIISNEHAEDIYPDGWLDCLEDGSTP